jgi:hypothetical protein
LFYFAREAAGAAGIRRSPRPHFEASGFARLGRIRREIVEPWLFEK